MQPQTNRDAIVIEIEIDAPPERVFRALSDPDQLVEWWNEEGGAAGRQKWEFDARLGGRWKASGATTSGDAWETWGEIVDFDPPRLLAITWHERLAKPRPFGATLVRYELEPTGRGTRLRLTHSGFAGYREAFEDYSKGWRPVVNLLRDYVVAAP